MRTADLARRRLAAQRLTGEPFASPVEAVRALGAVQSQDFAGARWALAQRTGASGEEIDRLFDEGAILRTHVLRPTWHFVLPEDVDRLLRLTGPRIRDGFMAARHRQLEIDAATLDVAARAVEAALAGGRSLTRLEMNEVLAGAGLVVDAARLLHLTLSLEVLRVIVSGPRRGRRQTWALFDERAPRAAAFDPEEAAADLALRYFTSHGPARLEDFAWWSGLRRPAARRALEDVADQLEAEEIDGTRYWFSPGAPPVEVRPTAHLLANFDEYLVAYSDRSAAVEPGVELDTSAFAFSSILANVVIVDGLVRGGWRRTVKDGLELRLLKEPAAAQRKLIEAAADAAAAFFGARRAAG